MLLDYILGGVIAFGTLVTVHEFGHFIVARWCGVKVLVFSIGFGKKIWSRTDARGTVFQLAVIPLGGYVKLLNRHTICELPEAQREAVKSEVIEAKRWWQKTSIVLAGPFINLIFAALLFAVIAATGSYQLRPIVGLVDANSLAGIAGMKTGDTILQIGKQPINTWQEAELEMLSYLEEKATIPFLIRNKSGLSKKIVVFADLAPSLLEQSDQSLMGFLGLSPHKPLVTRFIDRVIANSPAEKAGIMAGDLVVAVKGTQVSKWQDIAHLLASNPNQPIVISIDRGGELIDVIAQLEQNISNGQARGFLGVVPKVENFSRDDYFVYVKSNIFTSLIYGVQEMWRMSVFIVRSIYYLFVGSLSLDSVSGPIGIVTFAGEAFSFGLQQFFHFVALLSISLGIFNLLPLPILDGGHFIIYTLESILGRQLSSITEAWLFRFGAVIILAIASVAIFNDLTRLLG